MSGDGDFRPGDTTIRESMDVLRRAARGKAPSNGDRRKPERLSVKDWLGYVLAFVTPLIGAMLLVWQSQAVQDEQIANLSQDNAELKHALQRHIDKSDDQHAALWRRVID